MSYQPVYGTIAGNNDNIEGHSGSRRGTNWRVGAWFNTEKGVAGTMDVSIDRRTDFDYYRLSECKDKIAQYAKAGNAKKEAYWAEQLEKEEELQKQEEARKLRTQIVIKHFEKQDINITLIEEENGKMLGTITKEDLLQVIQNKKLIEAL